MTKAEAEREGPLPVTLANCLLFNASPAFGYWEIDGKAVNAWEADHGSNPHAKWKPIEDRQRDHAKPEGKTP